MRCLHILNEKEVKEKNCNNDVTIFAMKAHMVKASGNLSKKPRTRNNCPVNHYKTVSWSYKLLQFVLPMKYVAKHISFIDIFKFGFHIKNDDKRVL